MPLDSPTEVITALVVAALSGGGVVSAIEAIRHRGKDKAETTATVSAAAVQLMQMLQTTANEAQVDSDEARKASKSARNEADMALRQMHEVRQEMELLAFRWRRMTGAILDDNVTREELKILARGPGTGRVA